MAGREEPYDPYIPANNGGQAGHYREDGGSHRDNAGTQRTDVIQEVSVESFH